MPLCSVFLLYYHITFSQRKKEVKGNKKSVKNTAGKMIELSTSYNLFIKEFIRSSFNILRI